MTEKEAKPSFFKKYRLAFILLAVGVFALMSLNLVKSAVFVDEWANTYVGEHLDAGHLPYRDMLDNKGLFNHLYYKALNLFFPDNFVMWKISYLPFILFSAILLLYLFDLKFGKTVSFLAFVAFLAFNLHSPFFALAASETFGLCFILLMLVLLLKPDKKRQVAAGLLLALVLLTNTVFAPVVLALVWLAYAKEIFVSRYFIASAAAAILLFVSALTLSGSLPDFINQFIVFNQSHPVLPVIVNSILTLRLPGEQVAAEAYYVLILRIIFLSISCLALLLCRMRSFVNWGVGLLLLGGPAWAVASVSSAPHYELLMVPLNALGFGLAYLLASKIKWPTGCDVALLVTYGLLFFLFMGWVVALPPNYFAEDYAAQKAELLRTEPGLMNARMLTVDLNDVYLYHMLHGTYPGKYFFIDFMNRPQFNQTLKQDLSNAIPATEYIITSYPMNSQTVEPGWGVPLGNVLPYDLRMQIMAGFECRQTNLKSLYTAELLMICKRNASASGAWNSGSR